MKSELLGAQNLSTAQKKAYVSGNKLVWVMNPANRMALREPFE